MGLGRAFERGRAALDEVFLGMNREPSTVADARVLIAGAGPTGLVLALWLTRLGISVRIVDKAAEPGTTSRALAVQARTLELYRQVGLADAVVAGGVSVANVNLWVKGRRAARVPLRRIGEGTSPYPFLQIFPQDAHERLLIERLGELGVTVERPTELLRFEQRGDGVRATLRRPDGAEDVCEAARHLYGGRTNGIRRRLAGHCRPSSNHFSATFAFRIARRVGELPGHCAATDLDRGNIRGFYFPPARCPDGRLFRPTLPSQFKAEGRGITSCLRWAP